MENDNCVFDYSVNVGDVVQCMIREPGRDTGNTSNSTKNQSPKNTKLTEGYAFTKKV